MKTFRTALLCLSVLGASLSLPVAAQAPSYPNKPITWVVGYPPGGGVDFIARTLSKKMSADLGQTIVIDNRPGAAGIIAASAIARANPDGYTIGSVGNGELVYNSHFYKKLAYSPDKDFVAIGPVAKVPFLLAVNSSIAAKSVKELTELAKRQPLQYASGGLGHPNHLAMEMFKSKAGVDLQNIPYKGMAPALQDFLSGQVPVMFIDLATATAQMGSGKFRVLAVSTRERLGALPDVPTMIEAGVPNFDVYAWQGLAAPANTPRPVIERIHKSLNEALKDPAISKAFEQAGMQAIPSSPDALNQMVVADGKYWTPLIRSLNISLD